MSASLTDLLGAELDLLLKPLEDAATDPSALAQLLERVGATPDGAGGDALVTAIAAVVNLRNQIDQLVAQPSPSFEGVAAVVAAAGQVFSAVRALSASGGVAAQLAGLGEDLIEVLTARYLRQRHPRIFAAAVLLGLVIPAGIDPPPAPILDGTTVVRRPFSIDRFHLEKLSPLIQDPLTALRAEYGSIATADNAAAMAAKLFPRLSWFLNSLGLSTRCGIGDGDDALLGDAAPFAKGALLIYFVDPVGGGGDEAGVALTLSPTLGVVVSPFGVLALSTDAGAWTFSFTATADVQAFAIGPSGFQLRAGAGVADLAASFVFSLAAPSDGTPATVIGSATGSRLEIGGAKIEADLALSTATRSVQLSAAVSSAALVIAAGDGDGFLQRVLPPDGLRATFDLGLQWSNSGGLSLRGGAGLDATLPVHISLGGFSIPTVHLALQASDASVLTEVSASIALSLGPVHALVDRVGIKTLVSFPESGGNLGVADLSFGFKPPSGVGLAIDAIGVSGGGYLSFDPAKGQYAGVMQFHVDSGIALTAIGLIATRLPNGAKGYSFVVLITAEDFEPIPLGLGFTLTGIGGLLAINRTCDEEFLREGIKSNTLNSLLYPVDPIRNAVQILGTLNSAFPPRDGSYLFGPVVQICWGTPPVLTMDLGLILELGNRERLIILGRVSAIMPSEKHDLIRLQMNVLGIIDFDQHSISLDAILYDSRLVGKFPITGSMAMRLNWGSAPVFALSIGGFHPAFKPPAKFPTLERLAISFSNTDDFRLRAESYIAITSNTYQFGAKLELYARAGGFSIEGRVGYDVLIQYDPFGFAADFYASVQLKYHSDNLFAVKIAGELAGPQPLHIKGKATFEIFWCDFSVSFDHTFLKGDPPPLLAPVEVLPLLKVALDDPRNWSGQLAEGERRMVTLRDRQASGQIALHPLGKLAVQQTIVPLELVIAKFGNAKPADALLFKINSLSVNGKATQFTLVKDFFAPSQFLELTDDERLAAPSFEAMTAGISVGTEGFLFTTNDLDIVEDGAITYETIILDKGSNAPRAAPPVAITAEFLDRHISLGAAAHSDVRRTGNAKYRSVAGKNSLIRKGWTIVSTADGSAQAAPGLEAGKVVSYAETFQALHQLKQVNPAMAKNLMLLRVAAP